MILFIIGILALLLGLAWLKWGYVSPAWEEDRYAGRVTHREKSYRKLGWIGVALGAIAIILSCFTVVGARNVGVETFANAPTGRTMDAGLHVKAPWNSVTDIDGSIQPEEYRGDDCISVKIADGGTACVTISYRWRINAEGADTIYSDFRKSDTDITDTVRSALVSTNIKAAINEVLGKYDPLSGAGLDENMTPEELASLKVNVVPDYEQLNSDIQANVERKISDLGELIDIQSVTVSYLKLPDTTEDRINAFNQAVQNTRIALQEVATKEAQAEGNRVLAESLQDPNVLVAQCLDGLISGDISNQPGFSCWGESGSVVIPGIKQ